MKTFLDFQLSTRVSASEIHCRMEYNQHDNIGRNEKSRIN